MNYPKELKYLSEITCIADFFLTGAMNRTDEEFTLNSCVKQFMDFAHKANELPKEANNAWSMVTAGREGVGLKQILEKQDLFNTRDAMFYYNEIKRSLQAISKLKELYIVLGGDIFTLGNNLHVYCWKLQHILDYREKMPKNLAIALQSILDVENVDYTELRRIMYQNNTHKNA